jgi:hypothetical protein
MAKIKRLNYGVVLEDNEGHTFNFPLNSIILAAEDKSDMVNIKLKSYRRTIMSLKYNTFTEPTADSAENLIKIIQDNIIYY